MLLIHQILPRAWDSRSGCRSIARNPYSVQTSQVEHIKSVRMVSSIHRFESGFRYVPACVRSSLTLPEPRSLAAPGTGSPQGERRLPPPTHISLHRTLSYTTARRSCRIGRRTAPAGFAPRHRGPARRTSPFGLHHTNATSRTALRNTSAIGDSPGAPRGLSPHGLWCTHCPRA